MGEGRPIKGGTRAGDVHLTPRSGERSANAVRRVRGCASRTLTRVALLRDLSYVVGEAYNTNRLP
jgi:hypothetical protein